MISAILQNSDCDLMIFKGNISCYIFPQGITNPDKGKNECDLHNIQYTP